jgi:hypothetical protein
MPDTGVDPNPCPVRWGLCGVTEDDIHRCVLGGTHVKDHLCVCGVEGARIDGCSEVPDGN